MHTSTGPIIQVTADIDYPPTPPPTDVDDASSTQGTTEPSDIHRVAKHISPPFRYEKILIQDPEIIEAMDIRRWQRELGDKPKISSKDTFKLYPVGGREAMVGIVGSPRHTYINWWELAGRENRVPEWQEVMHVAAELGRDVKEVHEEILEYMRSFSGRGAGTGL
jgi:sulfur relay (sulfurtransferase) DsrC/TusE family protein